MMNAHKLSAMTFIICMATACSSQPKMKSTATRVSSIDGEILRSTDGTPLKAQSYEAEANELADESSPVPMIEEITIHFPSNGISLTSEQYEKIDEQLAMIADDQEIEVIGFADSTGDYNYNLDLSAQRASVVGDYLATKGIDTKKIKTMGAGELHTSTLSQARVVKLRVR